MDDSQTSSVMCFYTWLKLMQNCLFQLVPSIMYALYTLMHIP